ncbi:MAG: hypothetical protein V2I65_07860 [Paracoccaceae bacterium]|nr:hypothetical protein [Paracoccaceae bacterium]
MAAYAWRNVGIRLVEVAPRTGKSGESGSKTVFRKVLMSVETPRPVPCVVVLSKVGGVSGGLRRPSLPPDSLQPVDFPHPEVGATFEADAEDPDAAWQALSPPLRPHASGRRAGAWRGRMAEAGGLRGLFGRAPPAGLARQQPFFPLAAFNRTESQVAEACRQVPRRIAPVARGDRPADRRPAATDRRDAKAFREGFCKSFLEGICGARVRRQGPRRSRRRPPP